MVKQTVNTSIPQNVTQQEKGTNYRLMRELDESPVNYAE